MVSDSHLENIVERVLTQRPASGGSLTLEELRDLEPEIGRNRMNIEASLALATADALDSIAASRRSRAIALEVRGS
jgi:DNA polymerase III alpha subunit